MRSSEVDFRCWCCWDIVSLIGIYTRATIVSLLEQTRKTRNPVMDSTLDMVMVIDTAGVININIIEAVFIGNRCGRRGSGCGINNLTRAIAMGKPGPVSLYVRKIVPRTVGLWRLVGIVVVR